MSTSVADCGHSVRILTSDATIDRETQRRAHPLAVRMLEDAFHQTFDVCHLYTSDVDFLPVIHAIRARGKQVYVHGYSIKNMSNDELLFVELNDSLVACTPNEQGKKSRFNCLREYVPDAFLRTWQSG